MHFGWISVVVGIALGAGSPLSHGSSGAEPRDSSQVVASGIVSGIWLGAWRRAGAVLRGYGGAAEAGSSPPRCSPKNAPILRQLSSAASGLKPTFSGPQELSFANTPR